MSLLKFNNHISFEKSDESVNTILPTIKMLNHPWKQSYFLTLSLSLEFSPQTVTVPGCRQGDLVGNNFHFFWEGSK